MKGCFRNALRGCALLIAAFIALTIFTTNNTNPDDTSPVTITTTKGEFTVPGDAFMDGRDPEARPPLTINKINIWNTVPRQRVVCTLGHGVAVDVLEVREVAEEDRYYFKVNSDSCEGWVSEPFLSTESHEPVGDLVQ